MVEAAFQANHSEDCFLFKVDLERAFRNLRIDPNDYDLLGLYWDQAYFIDSGVPFGAKLGSFSAKPLQMHYGPIWLPNIQLLR